MAIQTRKKNGGASNSPVSIGGKPLRVAICLFGQPRRAKEGFEIFKKLMNEPYHSNITFDIFFHSWIMYENPGGKISYTESAYRILKKENIEVNGDILEQLLSMYKPVSFDVSTPITFKKDAYENTLLYNNTDQLGKNNLNNVLSQTYSRQKVRDVLASYIKATGTHYDFVIGTRFDFLNEIGINLNTIEPTNLHVGTYRFPIISIPDVLAICNQDMFLKMFNIFNNFHNIMNNKQLEEKYVKLCKARFWFHPDEIFHINYLYYFKDNKRIEYHDELPKFDK